MHVIATDVPDVLIIDPKLFGDQRGFFLETYQSTRYAEHGIRRPFVQDNLSRSAYGVLRGLHLQNPMTQGKLVSVLRGRVLDVAVDVRVGSPYFGRHVAVELSEENRRQLWVPRGFAHGFVVLSETADFFYKCDESDQPQGRNRGALGRSGDRHQMGRREPVALRARRRGAAAVGGQESSRLWTGLMRIVVTGVTGQVGRALVTPLAQLGTVVPADRSVLNLAEPATLAGALDHLAPDLIVNPAAYTAVDRAEDERDLAFTINGEAPGVIAEWAARREVPLVHFSTDYVFNGQGETPWREDSPTGPLSAYGESKLAGEEAIRAANGAYLIVRTSWVYAAQGANFLRTIARLARERTELKIVADQIGAPTSAESSRMPRRACLWPSLNICRSVLPVPAMAQRDLLQEGAAAIPRAARSGWVRPARMRPRVEPGRPAARHLCVQKLN